jgi:hypothetical protein
MYVCTPSGQVLRVVAGSGETPTDTEVLFPGSEGDSYHDCVSGPDGLLYVANSGGNSILRLNPDAESPLVDELSLGFEPRGVAFNVTTLYITSATNAVFKWVGQEASDGDPLTFGGYPTELGFTIGTPGRGVVFDVEGNMVLASNGKLHTSPPSLYNSASELLYSSETLPIKPFGVAVNTCKEVVFANADDSKIYRVTSSGSVLDTGIEFGEGDIPRYIEVASNNDMFIVTTDAQKDNGKVWRADFAFETKGGGGDCNLEEDGVELLVDLEEVCDGDELYCPNGDAMGIALAPTHHSLPNTFSSSDCDQTYDFGYHSMRVKFASCAAFTEETEITIEAYKSTLGQVSFSFSTTAEGVPYSPMGGHIIQYLIGPSAESQNFGEFQVTYAFFTQKAIAIPGVAKAESLDPDVAFTNSTGTDFYDVGLLDPAAGERDVDFSKRVVFNAAFAAGVDCTWGPFENPFGNPNHVYKSDATAKIASTPAGTNCGNGTVRISIVRVFPNGTYEPQVVRSKSETDNIMRFKHPKYEYALDLSALDVSGASASQPAVFVLTMWGDVSGPITRQFRVKP